MSIKSGFKTTEFAFVVVFAVLALLGVLTGYITDPGLAAIATAVVGAAYAIARGLAKQYGYDASEHAQPMKKR